jgi:lipopolysaccharide export system protein LptC
MAVLEAPRRTVPRNIAASATRLRNAPSAEHIARRRAMVTTTKLLLPTCAMLLLVSIAVWPQLERQFEAGRLALHRMSEVEAGRLTDARYRGVDERGRPYAFTATSALQVTPERIDLTEPKGDIVTESGAWLMLQSDQGVYLQHAGLLDLSGHVVLYRDDGTTLRSDTAAIDLKQGAAIGSDNVSAEGPFGTLDAMGYTLVDKGAIIQFTGPARLVLNSRTQ